MKETWWRCFHPFMFGILSYWMERKSFHIKYINKRKSRKHTQIYIYIYICTCRCVHYPLTRRMRKCCLAPLGFCNDLEIMISEIGPSRRGRLFGPSPNGGAFPAATTISWVLLASGKRPAIVGNCWLLYPQCLLSVNVARRAVMDDFEIQIISIIFRL